MEQEVQDVTNVTENADEQTVEEIADGVELTDTTDNTIENSVEETEEEQPKGRFYTDEEVNKIVNKRIARHMRKYEEKMSEYQDTENVLKNALEVDNIADANKKLRSFYEEQGYNIPERNNSYSEKEIQILAKAEAEQIIDEGYDSVLDEASSLAKKGYQNLNQKEKILFMTLGAEIDKHNDVEELKKIGANEKLLEDSNFNEFRNMFDKKTPISKVYGLYKNQQPKPKVELPGSMKNATKNVEKEFLTPEEVVNLTPSDWEKPGMWEKVRNSQMKWQN